MPTAHRQRMIDAGVGPPHHGHEKRAVKEAAALEKADQDLQDAADKAAEISQETAANAEAERRAAHAARHDAQREARKFRRNPTKK